MKQHRKQIYNKGQHLTLKDTQAQDIKAPHQAG